MPPQTPYSKETVRRSLIRLAFGVFLILALLIPTLLLARERPSEGIDEPREEPSRFIPTSSNATLTVNGDTILGNTETDTSTLRGLVVLPDSSATYPLRFGSDVDLYRGAPDRLDLGAGDSLNLVSGNLLTGNTTRLTAAGILQNITGITSSGNIVFTGLGAAGIVQADAAGNLNAGQVDRNSTSLGGILSIANGGTAAATAQSAINNLAGLTQNGDLLYFDGSNVTRLPRGANGECLIASAASILWSACPGGGGGITTLTLAGSAGVPQAINDSDTITIAAGTNITTTAGATDTVTVSVVGNPTFTGLVTANSLSVVNNATVGGPLSVTGSVTAASFSGDGSALTALNASNVAAGTLDDARLSGNVSLLGPSIDSSEITDGSVQAVDLESTNAAVDNYVLTYDQASGGFTWVDSTTFGGSGVGSVNTLTGNITLQGTAGQITVTDDGNDTITLALHSSVTLQGNVFNGPNQLIQLNGSGQIPALDGSLITALNATQLTSGTVPAARLSGSYTGITGVGTLTVGTWQATTVAVGFGGTGATTFTPNGVLYGNGTGAIQATAAGTTGQCLLGNTGSGPTWGSCAGSGTTFFTLAGTSGTPQSINGGDTVTIAAGTNITTTAGATDTVTISVIGNPTFSGAVTAASFAGDGSALTSLNATNIASGTLDNARLDASVSLLGQTIEGNEIANSAIEAVHLASTNAAVDNYVLTYDQVSGGFTWVDSSSVGASDVDSLNSLVGALTLQGMAGQITVTDDGNDTITLALHANVTLQGNSFNGANQLVQLNGSGQLPALDASLLTALNATQLTSGTVPAARLSGSYTGITGVGTIVTGTWQGTTVGISYGGTGATTAQGAINAISGLTTNGDLLYHNGSNSTRLPRGANGQCLTSNATTILWGTCANAATTFFTLAGTSGTPQSINGGDTVTIAAGSNITTTAGATDTVTIAVVNNPTFSGLVTANGAGTGLAVTNNATVGGTLAVDGTISSGNTSTAGSFVLYDGSSHTGTLQVASLGQNTTYTLPDPGGASADICLSTGNCAGAGGGITGSGSNNTLAKFTGSGTIGNSSITDNGSTVAITGDLTVSGSAAATSFSQNGNQVCDTSGNCAGVGGTGDILQGGNSFGATMVIGTNDAHNLQLETNGIARLTINSAGAATFTGSVAASGFSGSGASLTSLNATQLTSGTVPAARLSGSYTGITGVGTLTVGTWQATTVAVGFGGTGATTFTPNGILYGNGTGAIQATAAGTTGQCLIATTGSAPSWGSCAGSGVVDGTGVTNRVAYWLDSNTIDADDDFQFDGTDVTLGNNLNVGGAIQTAGTTRITSTGVLQNVTNANAGTFFTGGTLSVVRGGTGFGSYAVGDLLYADSTSSLAKLAGVATGNALISGGVGTAPSWGKIGLTTHVSGILGAGNGGTGNGFTAFTGPATSVKTFTLPNASATILTTNATVTVAQGGTGATTFTPNGVLYGNGTGAIQATAAGTTGQCLLGNTGSGPTWGSCAGSGTTFFTLAGTSGTPQSINGGDTVTIAAGSNITTTAGATDTVTIAVVNNPTFSGLVTANGAGTGLAVTNNATVGGTLDIAGHAAIGSAAGIDDTTLVSPAATWSTLLTLEEEVTTTSVDVVAGIANYQVLDPGATAGYVGVASENLLKTKSGNSQDFTFLLFGVTGVVQHEGSGEVNSALGMHGIASNDADGLINQAFGFSGGAKNNSSGTIWNARGAVLSVENLGTGTILTGHGLQVVAAENSGGGTFTRNTGISIEEQSAATHNTNLLIGTSTIPDGQYSIYNSSTGQNYFAGNVGIGDSSPSYLLTVGNGDLFGVNSSGNVIVTALGTANTDTVVCRNSSNILATCNSTFLTSSTAFVQGGNTFGTTATLGTNDNNSLVLETNNTTAVTIDTSQNVTVAGNLTVSGTGASSVAGTFDVAGHMAIGANAAIDDLSLLYTTGTSKAGLVVAETVTSMTDTRYRGIASLLNLNPGAGTSTQTYALEGNVAIQSGNSQNLSGTVGAANFVAHHNGNGDLGRLVGTDTEVIYDSASAANALVGSSIWVDNDNDNATINIQNGIGLTLYNSGTVNSLFSIASYIQTWSDSSTTTLGGFSSYIYSTGASDTVLGVDNTVAFDGSTTIDNVYGDRTLIENFDHANTLTTVYGNYIDINNHSTGTIGTGYGLHVASANNSSGTFTTNYGIYVAPQTAAVSDYGVVVGAADTQTLWLSSNADNTSAAAGIAFGSSRDTNLYRSAANTLRTDDSFVANLNLTVNGNTTLGNASGDSLTIQGTNVSIPNNLNFDSNTLFIDAANNKVAVGTATTTNGVLSIGGTAPDVSVQGSGLYISTLLDSTTNSQQGIRSVPWVDPPSASSQAYYGGVFGAVSDSSNLTNASLFGVAGHPYYMGTGSVSEVHAVNAYVQNVSSGTINAAIGVAVLNPDNSGTINHNYGVYVQAQTAGTNDYGVAIGAADTQTLWVSQNTNSTTAAGGIAFGSSRDTNLYRSGANVLRTDDAFSIGGQLLAHIGSENAPGYSFSSDTDTGMYLDGTTLGFSINGSNVFWLEDGGAFGSDLYFELYNSAEINGGTLVLGAASQAGTLQVSDGSNNRVTITVGSLSSNYTLTLPGNDGNNGECLKSNGSGVLSWGTCATTTGNTHDIYFSPEYQGATLYADGSDNSGIMISDWVGSLSSGDGYEHNYYEWTTSQAGSQDYDIKVGYRMPGNFSSFVSNSLKIWTYSTSTGNTSITFSMQNVTDNSTCISSANVEPNANSDWQQITITNPGACSLSAGDRVIFTIKVGANSSGLVRVGEFEFSYSD